MLALLSSMSTSSLMQAHKELTTATAQWNQGGRRKYQGGETYPRYLDNAMTAFDSAMESSTLREIIEYAETTGSSTSASAWDYLA